MKKNNLSKKMIIFIIVFTMISTTFLSVTAESKTSSLKQEGFEKGIPWQPFNIIKKTTFVNFDKDSLVDDYSYLASIPASVFNDGEIIYTNPLLFFQPDNTYPDEKEYSFLNDYDGTHYLMEDWMGYCGGKLDKLTTINVDESELEQSWDAKTYTSIKNDDPFQIASQIALDEWSYSDEAVLSVIQEEFEKPKIETEGHLSGSISGSVSEEQLKVDRPYGPASSYSRFQVGEEYKYVEAVLWYNSFAIKSKILNMIPGFGDTEGLTMPSVDTDLQLFCKYEGDWLQTSAASEMTITHGPCEYADSYVYQSGDWRIGVTNMPTEDGDISSRTEGLLGKVIWYGDKLGALKNAIGEVTELNVDIKKYPGVEIEIPDTPSFGCRDAVFELKWNDKNVNLGLTLIGPNGEQIDNVRKEDADSQKMKLNVIGECLKDERYKIIVYSSSDISQPIDFEVEYRWLQNISKKEGDMLSSACQGAVLGSVENNPLLFMSSDNLPSCTKNTLLKLGVEKVSIIDIGGYLSKDVKDEVKEVVKIKEIYSDNKEIYDSITTKTESTDIVFSTIDSWSWWYSRGADNGSILKPDGEYEGAFYFAPAAYAAAQHGTPLLLIDNHPELSAAATWHIDFWRKNPNGVPVPNTACMYLTGRRVYEFLDEYGFDKKGPESILTVAGQYEIGPTWTRMFAGPDIAYPGSIIGTPVDVTNHISRCIFYPALIFENPSVQGTVTLENGSKSERAFHVDGKLFNPFKVLLTRLSLKSPGLTNLKITRPSQEEEFENTILHTYGCYSHRVNERGYEYWGTTYKTRTGYTPGEDLSGLEIDQGTREIFEGKKGSFLPDISNTVYGPFYAKKAGYSNAFSTNFDVTIDNLNQGVISWYMILHGSEQDGGRLAWWEPPTEYPNITLVDKIAGAFTGSLPYEDSNPWRGYDMWWGSTEEPDSATLNSRIGLFAGWVNQIVNMGGRLPIDLKGKGILRIGLDFVPAHLSGYYDGLIGPFSITAMITKFHYSHSAFEVEEKLENLHSMNLHSSSCLIGCNYLQIAFMRHGSVLQEMDPWATSYWGGYTYQQIPKAFALGESVGEAYSKGITEIGPQYIFKDGEETKWWWDTKQNVVSFADPDLHIWVPSTEWDEEESNHWEKEDVKTLRYDSDLDINGHMPFGVDEYPNEKQPTTFYEQYMVLIVSIILIAIVAFVLFRKSKNKK